MRNILLLFLAFTACLHAQSTSVVQTTNNATPIRITYQIADDGAELATFKSFNAQKGKWQGPAWWYVGHAAYQAWIKTPALRASLSSKNPTAAAPARLTYYTAAATALAAFQKL